MIGTEAGHVSNATLDRVLALLVTALVASGLLTLRAGVPTLAWLFLLHALLAGGLLTMVGLKLWRSLPRAVRARRWGRLSLGLLVSFLAVAALTGGLLWAASGRIVMMGQWTILTIHAWVGLVLLPLVVLHLLPHRWRLLRPRLRSPRLPSTGRVTPAAIISRRTLLAVGGLLVAAAIVPGSAALVERLLGGERRFTGSRWLPPGGVPPSTTFFGDATPSLDPAAWRVHVEGRVAQPLALDLAGLQALGDQELSAILDCTSGWALETRWSGVPLAALLDRAGTPPDAGRIEVRSVTGWSTTLSLAEARMCLLATGVAGGELPAANGAPCRLVVPDRRGLDWVKWVSRIVVA